ncbi:PHP domain-containing protein [Candidatus Bathyarchaeota archaeon]|nr:PHP domain-containing protein [Candidatus Bathyarchaeota archaeon]
MHTCYSYDGLIKPKELSYYARKKGVDGVAITDHNRIDGALKIAKQITEIIIIPGIEISSLDGHIVGLNLQEDVPKSLTIEETVEKIHALGGLAVACHPKAFLKSSLGKKTNSKFDAIEVINASAIPFKRSVRQAQEIASSLGVAQVAGSDAHYGPEIGSAYTVIYTVEHDREKIVEAIRKGFCQPLGEAIPLSLRLKREFLALKHKRVLKSSLGSDY